MIVSDRFDVGVLIFSISQYVFSVLVFCWGVKEVRAGHECVGFVCVLREVLTYSCPARIFFIF